MSTRKLHSPALAITLLLLAAGPVLAQERAVMDGVDRAPMVPAGPAPSFPGVSTVAIPPGMLAPEPLAAIPLGPATDGGEDASLSSGPGLGVVLTAVGGGLIAGALVDFLAGSGRLGLDGAQAGAFGSGLILATWGGIRVSAAAGPGS